MLKNFFFCSNARHFLENFGGVFYIRRQSFPENNEAVGQTINSIIRIMGFRLEPNPRQNLFLLGGVFYIRRQGEKDFNDGVSQDCNPI